MKRKLLGLLLCMTMLVSMLVGCGSNMSTESDAVKSESEGKYKVYLITMDQMDQYWLSVNKGCGTAADELGNIEFKWSAPDVKDDAKQIECINNAVADKADVILLAANGPDAVTAALDEAAKAGVKIVYIDSPANFDGEVTFATNNKEAGELAGKEMLKALTEKNISSGKIGIINVNVSTASCVSREEGFRSAFEGTNFKILETQYSDGDSAKAKDIAANYITNGCIGIFGANEGCATGVGNAIQEDGDRVVGVGFDKSDTILSLIKEGHLLATMEQNPYDMGYKGMKAAAEILAGRDFDGKIEDTGVTIITKDNAK